VPWPTSPEALDDALCLRVSSDRPEVVDAHDPGAERLLAEQLRSFLGSHSGTGHLLVKTSTTTRRPVSHEVSTDLLTRVLHLVAELSGTSPVVLGDGPVFDSSYEAECERLGWLPIARSVGAEVRDLNRDPVSEIAPGWPISRTFLDARAVVSLTKAKTHRRFGVSLAEKALIGTVSGSLRGHPKLAGHHHAVPWLLGRITDVAPPIFSIIDGSNGIEGYGPFEGTPTSSHFLCFGRGCLAPDIRATVEMGFDPVLLPALHRPFPDAPPTVVRWLDFRVTDIDFEPPSTFPWLHHSLKRRWGRRRRFDALQHGVRTSWPSEGNV
jgi:uncharacterized protein (DUF362 family)